MSLKTDSRLNFKVNCFSLRYFFSSLELLCWLYFIKPSLDFLSLISIPFSSFLFIIYRYFREAYKYVKDRRACIKPNDGFVAQLVEYEPIYRARQTLEQGGSSCEPRRQKRKSDQLSELVDIDLIQPPPSPASESVNGDYRHEEVHDISNHLHRLWLLKTA